MVNMAQKINENQVVEIINSITGAYFVLEYIKADGSNSGKRLAQLHVSEPREGITPPGQGAYKGVSAKEALANGVIKYYDANKKADDGKRAAYRSCRIEGLLYMKVNGVEYEVIH
jgi:hypothetical protein